jgi:hypothetical protein
MRWVWQYGKKNVFLERTHEKGVTDLAVCKYIHNKWEIYVFQTSLHLPCPDFTDPKKAPLEYAEALVRLQLGVLDG